MKKSKSNQSKKKQLPKLKKYYEGGYSTPQGTFDSNGIMVAGPMGLPTNSPIQPKGSTVGNIVAGVDSVKKDSRKFNSYPLYQKVINADGTPTYWAASAKMSPEDFHSSSRGSDIKEFKGAAPIDEQTYIANKGTFNMMPDYTRHAHGGVYKNGGKIAKDIAAGLYGVGEGVLDTVTLGATDNLTDMGYKALQKAGGSSEDEIREQDSIHGYGQAAGAIGGGFINPAATGNAIAQAGEGLGEGVSRGNESKSGAQTAGMLLNTAGKIGGMAYGMAGSPMTTGMESQSSNFNNSNFGKNLDKYNQFAGQASPFMQNGGMYRHGGIKHPYMPHFSSFPPAPSGMYGTQLAYGGEQPNAEVEGGPNSQEAITPSDGRMPQVFGGGGLEQVSENPYGKPTYMTTRDSNTHEQTDSNGQTGVPVNLSPGTAISSNKTKNPMTNRPFLKDLLKITNKEKKHSDILANKDSTPSDINTARVVLPMLAKAKENFEKYMAAVVQNKEQAKQLKKGIIPSTDNEQAEPQGMSEQSEGEMAAARHGGMYANGGKLPEYLLKSRLESHMSPEEANDYIANYKSGGIHIKPENKGKFTAYKERTGKTTEEALHSPNAHVRQMANFARNAAKWKHEMGGIHKYAVGDITPGSSLRNPPALNMRNQAPMLDFNNPYLNQNKFDLNPGYTDETNHYFNLQQDQNLKPFVLDKSKDQYLGSSDNSTVTGKEQYVPNPNDPYEQAMAAGKEFSTSAPDPKDYSNYADYARQAAIFAGQNLGNIRDFVKTRGGKEFDTEHYGQMTPQMPDYSEALRTAQIEANATRKSLKDMTGGNVASYLSNLGSTQTQNALTQAKIREAEQQARTGVYNQFLPLNKQLEMQERADTQANKARSEDIARMAVKGLSENIGGAGSDYGMSKNDKETLAIISNAYPEYAYDTKKKGWYHRTTKEKLDPNKVKPIVA